jgi:ABC-type transport system substrate-binding protein
MLTSYEMPDLTTVIAHLRQDIYWQNIAPANGRQFVAADVVYHYDRMLGLGDGFTKPSTYFGTVVAWQSLISVTAVGNYTVEFKWKVASPEFITEAQHGLGQEMCMRPHEAWETWGSLLMVS